MGMKPRMKPQDAQRFDTYTWPVSTVLRLWTAGFPDPNIDRFGKPEDTLATVSIEPADDYWGPMILINTHDDEYPPKHNYVVRINTPGELNALINKLQAARDAWKEQ